MFHIVWKRKQPMMIWPHHCRKSLAPPSMELSYITYHMLRSYLCQSIGYGENIKRPSNTMLCSFLSQQKMDKNKDGVVTIDEFIESCQKVSKEKNSPFC